MSRWDRTVTQSTEEATRFWAAAPMETLNDMMAPEWAWRAWLDVACGVITSPGSVFEPGCGVGMLTERLPAGCSYFGCDVNPRYVAEAQELRARPGVEFEVRDMEEVLASGATFDWVIITSLFGMFPEPASYELMSRFWSASRRGLSVTTINKRLNRSDRRLRFDFTSHDPDDLLAAAKELPGAAGAELRHGRQYQQFKGHRLQRGLALYVWREAS